MPVFCRRIVLALIVAAAPAVLTACEIVEPPVTLQPIPCSGDCPNADMTTEEITMVELAYTDEGSVALQTAAEVTITLYGYPKQIADFEATVVAEYKATIARLNASVEVAVPSEPHTGVNPKPLASADVGYYYKVVLASSEYSTNCVVPTFYDAIPDVVTIPVSATPWCPAGAQCNCN